MRRAWRCTAPWISRLGTATSLLQLGFVAYHRGDLARSTELLRSSLRLARELDDRLRTCDSILGLAAVAVAEGNHARAARLLGIEETLRLPGVSGPMRCDCTDRAARMEAVRAEIEPAAIEALLAVGRNMAVEQAVAYAIAGEVPVRPDVS